ncbi:class I SAM-dependent methyltransferase [Streptomyces sp. NPDC048637]|uniref:class I SAM-dependent methyltransferase n=1 Tax=Streptomyces sp. NPDC048637 TaxID=3155636 RepID=UPI003442062A
MHTNWETSSSAQDYSHSVEAADWQTMGYPAVFDVLGLGKVGKGTVIDYGCGPGFVAQHVAAAFDHPVLAVDTSKSMVNLAAQKHPHSRVNHQHIASGRMSFLPDSSAGACMSCFVFMQIADRRAMLEACKEIQRVLRPNAVFAMLNTDPDSVGIQFKTLRNGEPDRTYASGDPMTTVLATEHGELTLRDYYWSVDDYATVVTDAGFRDVEVIHLPPPAGDSTPHPQFLLVHGTA